MTGASIESAVVYSCSPSNNSEENVAKKAKEETAGAKSKTTSTPAENPTVEEPATLSAVKEPLDTLASFRNAIFVDDTEGSLAEAISLT